MSENSPRLNLSMLQPNQAQKHVVLNEALLTLDALVQAVVPMAPSDTPPAEPAEGQVYALGANPEAAWTGRAGQLAQWRDAAWRFMAPQPGWHVYDRLNAQMLRHDGLKWNTEGVPETLPRLGVGTAPDAANLFAVKSSDILFAAPETSGDIRVKLNRKAADKVCSLIFQTAWLGQAEISLSGPGLAKWRTSANGSAFRDSIVIDTQTGFIGFGTEPTTGDPFYFRHDVTGQMRLMVSNLSSDNAASVSVRLNAASGKYLILQLYNSGTAFFYANQAMTIGTWAAQPLRLRTDTQDRMTIHADGRVSIATALASAQLSVAGAVRVGSFPSTALPSAVTNGAGALIWVTGLPGGAVLAVSDGTAWRPLALGAALA